MNKGKKQNEIKNHLRQARKKREGIEMIVYTESTR